jgi:hypothetical protein
MTQDPELQEAMKDTQRIAPAAPIAAPVADPEAHKLAAFLPQERTIAGKKLHPYTKVREIALRRTGNELLRIRANAIAYAQRHGKDIEALTNAEYLDAINETPDIQWHAVAFLFALHCSPAEVSRLSANPDKWTDAVAAFADTLRGGEARIMPLVLDTLIEAAAGNDYEVSESTPSPN